MKTLSLYPETPAQRTRWIWAQRGARNVLDPQTAYATLAESEYGPDGTLWETLTILLTNHECPFRCLMCDLWQNTLAEKTPMGAIPAQMEKALRPLSRLQARPSAIKLYNAGSFFDPIAIPEADYPAIAARVQTFDRVIVECHPAFLGERAVYFRSLLAPHQTLEVAIGLETVHPVVLERLNKRMTQADFARAATWLRENGMALRVFLLVRPPWLSEEEGVEWAVKSLQVALQNGATATTLIPTRAGNGAMERLAESGEFTPPRIASLLTALEQGIALGKGQMRVFADTWDIERFIQEPEDTERIARIHRLNETQSVYPAP